MTDFKKAILALLPQGPVGAILPEGDESKLYDGIGAFFEEIEKDDQELRDTEDPYKSKYFYDLERDYGYLGDPSMSMDIRRSRVAVLSRRKDSGGRLPDLEAALNTAGFTGLHVYHNDPPVNTNRILSNKHKHRCAEALTSRCSGVMSVRCSVPEGGGGEYLLSGDFYRTRVTFKDRCASSLNSRCADPPTATCGGVNITKQIINHQPSKWYQNVFFVGGEVTRVEETGAIQTLSLVELPASSRNTLHDVILRYKPVYTWACLRVNYVIDNIIAGGIIQDVVDDGVTTVLEDVTDNGFTDVLQDVKDTE